MVLFSVPNRVINLFAWSVVSCVLLNLNLAAQSTDPRRIENSPGIVVFREKSFYSDELVKCARFSRVEDRTAADNPTYGYFEFSLGSHKLQLPPEAIEGCFFLSELELPETLDGSRDLSKITKLKEQLLTLSRFNNSVASKLNIYVQRMSEAEMRLQKGESLERGMIWITKEERDRRTAVEEMNSIRAAASNVSMALRDAQNLETLTRVYDSISSIESLSATSKDVAGFRKDSIEQLKLESNEKRIDLEQAYVSVIKQRLKSLIESAKTLNEILAVRGKINDFSNVHLGTPEGVHAKDQGIKELRATSATKERTLRLSNPSFDSLDDWRKLIDETCNSPYSDDQAITATAMRSKELYNKSLEVNERLKTSLFEMNLFLEKISDKMIKSGESFPSTPSSFDDSIKDYEKFVVLPDNSSLISVEELEKNAAALRIQLSVYRQLAEVSRRDRRLDLWNDLEKFQEVLSRMTVVHKAILEEKAKYDALIAEACAHEQSKNFADASEAYQSALDIAPSAGVAEKVQSMKDQDLGL